jgi:hypothetical protein
MQVQKLSDFFVAIRAEKNITTSHISLYVTLFFLWSETGFVGPILITRKKVMKTAKIKSVATFHKCMKELNELRLIQYLPSRNPAVKSRVYLCKYDDQL